MLIEYEDVYHYKVNKTKHYQFQVCLLIIECWMALNATNDIIFLNMKAIRVKRFNDQMTQFMPNNSFVSTKKILFRLKLVQCE